MNETEAVARMVAPGTPRPGKYRQGVIQVWTTRACDKTCFGCTQGSNLKPTPRWDKPDTAGYGYITVEQYDGALRSLKGYWGVIGMFGGNPAMHPDFEELCRIARRHFPREQLGVWSNNPLTAARARVMRETFHPAVSNLNVHLDEKAFKLFKEGWPECTVVGLNEDSRHSPPYAAIKDLARTTCNSCGGAGGGYTGADGNHYLSNPGDGSDWVQCQECRGAGRVYDSSRAWELISDCDINKHWSAMIGVFRGQLRAWFCEIAGAQAMLHAHEPEYPDTGLGVGNSSHGYCAGPCFNEYNKREGLPAGHVAVDAWWKLPMQSFTAQVRKHCQECGVPLRGYGELARAELHSRPAGSPEPVERVSATHASVYHPRREDRPVVIVTTAEQLKAGALGRFTDYLGNSRR